METPPSVPIGFTPSIGMARTTIRSVLGDGREVMNDAEAKLVLEAYGVPTLTTRCASDPLQAAALAKDIGFPVAIKLLSDKVSTLDYAGVPLTLNTAEAVQDAAERMISRLHKRFPKARSQGFLVRKAMQRPSAHELLIGVTTDPIFGPLLLFGRGGSQANVIGDIAVALPPLNVALARELISRTRIYKYKALQGYRGHTAADINAICLTLTKLSQLIIDIPHIAQLQINPLLSDGYGVLVVEAYIRLQHNPSPVEERLAIRPYPQELEELFTLKTGRVVLLRPIRPEDEPEHQVFFSKIAFEDLHSRFFGSVGKFSHSHMAHLTQIDYEREMAFIATAPGENSKPETLGEVRTITDSDNSIAEFSVMVRSDQKKKGLGRRLTEKVIDYCRSRGTQKLVGHVLIRNHAAVCMLNSLGFQHQSVPDDPQIYEVWLNLEIARAERAGGFSSATQARLRKANKSN